MTKNLFLSYSLLLFIFCACSTNQTVAPISQTSTAEDVQYSDWAYSDYYAMNLKLALEDRDIKPSTGLLEYVSNQHDLDIRYVEKNSSKIKDVASQIHKLPKELKKIMTDKVIGWALVKNLGGNALPVNVFDEKNHVSKELILINESIVNKTYSQVCTRREESVYTKGIFEIRCISSNKNLSAIQYVFSRVLGNILGSTNSYSKGVFENNQAIEDLPFAKLSWQWDSNKKVIINKAQAFRPWMDTRKYFTINAKEKLLNELAYDHFNLWKDSNFPTLASAIGLDEDWVESFTLFVMKKYFGAEVTFSLFKNNNLIISQKSCLYDGLCKEKGAISEEALAQEILSATPLK